MADELDGLTDTERITLKASILYLLGRWWTLDSAAARRLGLRAREVYRLVQEAEDKAECERQRYQEGFAA